MPPRGEWLDMLAPGEPLLQAGAGLADIGRLSAHAAGESASSWPRAESAKPENSCEFDAVALSKQARARAVDALRSLGVHALRHLLLCTGAVEGAVVAHVAAYTRMPSAERVAGRSALDALLAECLVQGGAEAAGGNGGLLDALERLAARGARADGGERMRTAMAAATRAVDGSGALPTIEGYVRDVVGALKRTTRAEAAEVTARSARGLMLQVQAHAHAMGECIGDGRTADGAACGTEGGEGDAGLAASAELLAMCGSVRHAHEERRALHAGRAEAARSTLGAWAVTVRCLRAELGGQGEALEAQRANVQARSRAAADALAAALAEHDSAYGRLETRKRALVKRRRALEVDEAALAAEVAALDAVCNAKRAVVAEDEWRRAAEHARIAAVERDMAADDSAVGLWETVVSSAQVLSEQAAWDAQECASLDLRAAGVEYLSLARSHLQRLAHATNAGKDGYGAGDGNGGAAIAASAEAAVRADPLLAELANDAEDEDGELPLRVADTLRDIRRLAGY